MVIEEFKKVFDSCELQGDKIFIESNITKALSYLKDTFKFDILKEIVAVDCNESGVELIYRIYSIDNDEEVLISTYVQDNAESVSNIFDSAVADEKEIYDLFGVTFVGNKELKRLYMPESWKGNPLKKNYQENDERLSWND